MHTAVEHVDIDNQAQDFLFIFIIILTTEYERKRERERERKRERESKRERERERERVRERERERERERRERIKERKGERDSTHLIHGLELHEDHDGTKRLLLCNPHRVRHVREDRWLQEVPSARSEGNDVARGARVSE